MHVHSRLALWSLVALASAAIWPFAGYAFANVEIGERLETTSMPTLEGGKHELVARKALANVFIFFRPQQDHSLATLKAMADCEKEFAGKPVHWVAIVSGSWSKDEVKEVVAQSGIRMPVLVDEGDQLYGRLGVRLHPVVGIADGEGKLLAYEPFRKIHYCDIVRARIRFALKEIDAAEMDRVVNPEKAPMPSDIAGAVSRRNVKMGQMFLKVKNYDKAAESARVAIERDPTVPEAHLLLGDALAGAGDCAGAAKEYDEALKLAPGNAAAAEGKRNCGAK